MKPAAFVNGTATVDGLTAGTQYDYTVTYEGNIVAKGTTKPAVDPIQTLELYPGPTGRSSRENFTLGATPMREFLVLGHLF